MDHTFHNHPAIPIPIKDAILSIREAMGVSIFLSGGCGILATSLATACQKMNMPCYISLIHRYNPKENTDTLSHITLALDDHNQSIDIMGCAAETRWLEYFCHYEERTFGSVFSEFSFEDIVVTPGSKPAISHLQRLTRMYDLKLPISYYYEKTLGLALKAINE